MLSEILGVGEKGVGLRFVRARMGVRAVGRRRAEVPIFRDPNLAPEWSR